MPKKIPTKNQGLSHGSLCHAVLLRRLRWWGLLCNVMFVQKIIECVWNVFPTIIHPKNFYYVLQLPLHQDFSLFEHCQHLFLGVEHIDPNFVWEIVNEGEKTPCAYDGQRFHQPAYVGMHKLQDPGGANVSVRGECRLACLPPHIFRMRMNVCRPVLLPCPSRSLCFEAFSCYWRWDAPTSCAKVSRKASFHRNAPKNSFRLHLPHSYPMGTN